MSWPQTPDPTETSRPGYRWLVIALNRTVPDETARSAPDDFEAWIAPHLAAIARLAGRLSPPGERDDIIQAALLQAWRHRSSFNPRRGGASAWLLAITANEARKAFRNRRPIPVSAGRQVASLDDRLDVANALDRLAPRQRLAIDCYYFADLSIADTAAVMKCSEGTVKGTLADARTRLQALLGART